MDWNPVKYPDLLAKATDAYHGTLAINGDMAAARNVIYDALEAERDRCANIAEEAVRGYPHKECCDVIASAIRTVSAPE